ENRGVTLPVTLEALPIRGLTVPSLPNQRNHSEERNGHWIGHCFRGELKLGPCGKRAELVHVFDVQEVWQDVEKAVAFRSDLLDRGQKLFARVAVRAKRFVDRGDRLRAGARRRLLRMHWHCPQKCRPN